MICKIGDLILQTPLYNASGVNCTTLEELAALDADPYIGAVLSKSCTLNPRIGNPEPRYYYDGTGSINSTGLANLGIDEYLQFIAKNKPYIISIASVKTDADYILLLEKIKPHDNVHGVEINVSCPNIIGKPQLGYDFLRLDILLDRVSEIMINAKQTIGLKLPPYMDISHYNQVAAIIERHPIIKFITCCNSIGNCLLLKNSQASIVPNNGLGGLGGDYVKPLFLANVKIFRSLLPDSVAIIGCGGVKSSQDVSDYLTVGATAVQIGTAFKEQGFGIFSNLAKFGESLKID